MADQPARALIVYGDGLMRALEPRHSHIHAVAAAGCCGFLALRNQPEHGTEAERVAGELAQLLDIHDMFQKETAAEKAKSSDWVTAGDGQYPSLSERFMGIKAGMFTTSEPAGALGKQAGLSILKLQGGNCVCDSKPSVAAPQMLALLGLEDARTDTFDLLFLHIAASQQKVGTEKSCSELVDWVDRLIGELQTLAQPETKAGSHLYLVVVMGYGSVELSHGHSVEEDGFPIVPSNDGLGPELAKLVPKQSYAIKGGHQVENIREHHPLLVAYHLDAVTRRDEVKSFNHSEFLKLSGNLVILVDRFLHEVAFKLWKAPKYGA